MTRYQFTSLIKCKDVSGNMYRVVCNNLGLPMKARRLISNGVLGYILTIIYNIKHKNIEKYKTLETGRCHLRKISNFSISINFAKKKTIKMRSISSHTSGFNYDLLT